MMHCKVRKPPQELNNFCVIITAELRGGNLASKMYLSPLVASPVKMVVLLLLIHCLLLLPLFVCVCVCVWGGCLDPCSVMQYLVFFLVLQPSRCGRESWLLDLIILTIFKLCSCWHVAISVLSFPQGVVCWSVLCNCGISWSYSLAFSFFFLQVFPVYQPVFVFVWYALLYIYSSFAIILTRK